MVRSERRELDVRAQVSMVFHLDKCIGCHTCSLACKNVWTDRPGAEYMWWNNVETKPGTGYPTRWEDQETWRGGWQATGDGGGGERSGRLRLRSQGRAGGLLKLFYNPRQPGLEDYYRPWTYRYGDLFDAPAGADQPTAAPVSLLTGEPMAIESGPNWDDDLSGSPLYAENDPSLAALHPEERRALFDVERLVMTYLPRICNHCLNPGCVASCPSGALYKRGEDGIVLVDQERCRGWRACVVACPYKKTYYNWRTGKSEKCILCYPRLEAGEPPACFHACVGRIRYLGVLLYDAAGIRRAAAAPAEDLVEAQRAVLLDPRDPEVLAAARRCGVSQAILDAAVRSPVWRFVKEWELALPLHPEFRTVPMLYYVPPLLPVVGRSEGQLYRRDGSNGEDLFAGVEEARLPIRYLSQLFAAGNEEPVRAALRRLVAVRWHRRARELPSIGAERVAQALTEAGLTPEAADEIYRLTALATLAERYVVPPLAREQTVGGEGPDAAETRRQSGGFGVTPPPRRGP